MNEQKIKELVLATGLVEYDWREDMKYNSEDELVERLIEVVVKECISLFDGTKEMKTVGLLSHTQVIEQIKEHFGVEE